MQRFFPAPARRPPALPTAPLEEQAGGDQPNEPPRPGPGDQSKDKPQPAPPVQQTDAPPRSIKVSTGYWTIDLSNRGAVATSWILNKTRNPDGSTSPIFSADGKELQLVAQQAPDKFGLPLGIRTPWSPELGELLNEKNFQIEGVGPDESNVSLNAGGPPRTITFIYSSNEVTARKSFTFYGDDFSFDGTVEVMRDGEHQPVELVLGPRFGDQGHRQTGSYATPPQVIAHDKVGNIDRIPAGRITPPFAKITAIDAANNVLEIDHPLPPAVDMVKLVGSEEGAFIDYSRVLSRESNGQRLTLDRWPEGLKPGDRVAQRSDTLWRGYRWAALVDHYFAFVAVGDRPFEELWLTNVQVKSPASKDGLLDYPSLAVPMQPGSTSHFFVGPKDRHLLSDIGDRLGADLGGLIDYGMFRFAIRPLIPAIEWALSGSARLFKNYGWGIVLVTIVINLALSPLRFYSSKKMKKAAKHQPKIKELQDRMKKLKENPKKNQREIEQVQREQMEIMREANPLGGCLPLLLQMPIFWAFFVYLTISLDVRHAPWILWIKDLSSPDPYKILPIVMCVTMIGSTMLQPMPPPTDPSQKMQRVMMTWLMPLVLTWFFFFSAPSGLVLYWMVSNVVGVVIQLAINKLTTEPAAAPQTEPSKPLPKKPREGERYPRKRSSEA